MKKLFGLFFLLVLALPLAALRCGDDAAEFPRLKFLNSKPVRLLDFSDPGVKLKIVTFILTRSRNTVSSMMMLESLKRTYPGEISMVLVTPDPESDAAAFLKSLPALRIPLAVDSSRRITMQYMAGSLLYPYSFVIDRNKKIIWNGESVDLAEMLQEYFSGSFDAGAAVKTAPLMDELHTLLRASNESQMRKLTSKIFDISPAHPGALRIRLFTLENSDRIPQAWELLKERMDAVPAKGRLYFSAAAFAGRYPAFKAEMMKYLEKFNSHVSDPELRILMAWELLRRFQYDSSALQNAAVLLGQTPPDRPELRLIWLSGKARTAYLCGDIDRAITFQRQAARLSKKNDPMLEYFLNVKKLKQSGKF